jgi:gas vesicle protein
MADGYDRFENEGNSSGGGSFVMGLLTGTVLGAGLGMLFAPKAGTELRNQLSEQAGNLANTASDGYRKATETAGEWAERGKDMYGKAREAVAKGADEAQRYVKDAASSASGPTPATGPTSAPSGSSYGGSSESVRGVGSSSPTYGSSSDSTRGAGPSSGSSGGSHSGGSTGSSGTGGARRS